jgi:hypothetical protein
MYRMSEVRGQKSEVRGRRSEYSARTALDRRQCREGNGAELGKRRIKSGEQILIDDIRVIRAVCFLHRSQSLVSDMDKSEPKFRANGRF